MSLTFTPGVDTWYASDSPHSRFSGVFEDDGDTGYFYAYDREKSSDPILHAAHIYNVSDVTDRTRASVAQIVWSSDGLRAALLLNDYPHAVIDFAGCTTYSRNEFPPGSERWQHKPWDEALLASFHHGLP